MPNKTQRQQNANNYYRLMAKRLTTRKCPNCKEFLTTYEGHFVPPSCGEEGFFACEAIKRAKEKANESPTS